MYPDKGQQVNSGRETAAAFRIRPSRAADLAAVDALLRQSYPKLLKADYPPSIIVTAVPLISRAQPALLQSGTYYVAEDESGTIIGAGGWSLTHPQTGRASPARGSVRHFATDYRQTRRGVASALMGKVIAEATVAGLAVLDCQATRTAVPFYLSQGFRTVGDVSITLRPGIVFPAIQLFRPLQRQRDLRT